MSDAFSHRLAAAPERRLLNISVYKNALPRCDPREGAGAVYYLLTHDSLHDRDHVSRVDASALVKVRGLGAAVPVFPAGEVPHDDNNVFRVRLAVAVCVAGQNGRLTACRYEIRLDGEVVCRNNVDGPFRRFGVRGTGNEGEIFDVIAPVGPFSLLVNEALALVTTAAV